MEDKLRAKGFKVETETISSGETLKLFYTIDRLVEESGCYLTVNLSDGFVFSRIYQLKKDGYTPASAANGRK